MSLRYASLANSPRLQRALEALRQHPKGLTTRQWIQEANICACNSVAAELKAQGVRITCRPEGRGVDGSSIYRYTLEAA